MSVVASYVNTESSGAGDAVVFTREGKYGVPADCASPESGSDAQVGQIHPTYGYVVAVKRDVSPPLPALPQKRAHYQTPLSNMPVYERMDSVVSGGMSAPSPIAGDPSLPLVESTLEADNDAVLRKESRNPVYSKQEEGNDRKRVYRGETEEEVVTYKNTARRKCCDLKATVLSFFLLILFFMSAASLMLNLLMLFGGLNLTGCATCAGGQVTDTQVQALRSELNVSLQDLNTSFTQLVNLNVGQQGPRGYNGSAGPQGPQGEAGPEAVNGVIDLSDFCIRTVLECDLAVGNSSCETPNAVAPDYILSHWCSVKADMGGTVSVKTASLVTQIALLETHNCHCEATVNGIPAKCVYTRVSCYMGNVNVVLNYPETRNDTGNN